MKISVVVPVFNEGESVLVAQQEIARVFRESMPEHSYELIFVDDGSKDDSLAHITAMCNRFPEVRAISFSQNAGSHMAIRAGLEHATGSLAVFLACDLQDPPEVIPHMLEALRPPVQIVWAVRDARHDKFLTKVLSRTFFVMARLLVSKNLPPSGASMFMLGSEALRFVSLYNERNLTLEGLFATMGLPQTHVTYNRRERISGSSKWTLAKRLKLFADFFVGYSYTPIRMMSYAGITFALLGFVYAAVVLSNRIVLGTAVEGWTSLMLVLLIMGGIQMTMVGIIGEYVWRALDEVRRRPRYIVQQTLNLHPARGARALSGAESARPEFVDLRQPQSIDNEY